MNDDVYDIMFNFTSLVLYVYLVIFL